MPFVAVDNRLSHTLVAKSSPSLALVRRGVYLLGCGTMSLLAGICHFSDKCNADDKTCMKIEEKKKKIGGIRECCTSSDLIQIRWHKLFMLVFQVLQCQLSLHPLYDMQRHQFTEIDYIYAPSFILTTKTEYGIQLRILYCLLIAAIANTLSLRRDKLLVTLHWHICAWTTHITVHHSSPTLSFQSIRSLPVSPTAVHACRTAGLGLRPSLGNCCHWTGR